MSRRAVQRRDYGTIAEQFGAEVRALPEGYRPPQPPVLLTRFERSFLQPNPDLVAPLPGQDCQLCGHHVEFKLRLVGGLDIDVMRRRCWGPGGEITLTPREWQLVIVLAIHAGRVLTHTELIGQAFGPEWLEMPGGSSHLLRVNLCRIRNKLNAAGAGLVIETSKGIGYMVEVDRGNPD